MNADQRPFFIRPVQKGQLKLQTTYGTLVGIAGLQDAYDSAVADIRAAANLDNEITAGRRDVVVNPLLAWEQAYVKTRREQADPNQFVGTLEDSREAFFAATQEVRDTFTQAFTQGGVFSTLGTYTSLDVMRAALGEEMFQHITRQGWSSSSLQDLANGMHVDYATLADRLHLGRYANRQTTLLLAGENAKDRIAFLQGSTGSPILYTTGPRNPRGYLPPFVRETGLLFGGITPLGQYAASVYDRHGIDRKGFVSPNVVTASAMFDVYWNGANAKEAYFMTGRRDRLYPTPNPFYRAE